MAPASFVTCERAAGYRLLTGGRAAPRILKRTLRPEIESELVPVPRLPSPAGSWRQRLLLPLAFTGGLASLGIEFAAARLLAPFFGQSLFIWGTLIGLILIYLTIGYYAGGRLADRRPDARLLLLFAAPVILLGMVSPFVIRLRIRHLETAGNAAGAVYALSTLGSILGTFLPVFWLIPTYGTRPTIFVLAFLLGAISTAGLYEPGRRRLYLLIPAVIAVLALLSGGGIRGAAYGVRVYETESAYNYIQVIRTGTETQLLLDEGSAVHSIYDPTSLYTHGYWDDALLAPYFGSGRAPSRVALVGLAGGTVARQFTAIDGPIPIDGVEIDPKIVDVGRRYFDMTEPNLHVTVADGRYWMATQAGQYDVILVDAYRQPYIPFYLTTREFFESAKAHLNPGGVLAINVGRTPTDNRLVEALSGTLNAVFPNVFVLDSNRRFTNSVIYATSSPASVDQFIASAGAETNPKLQPIAAEALQTGGVRQVHANGIVFTDDLAPVERLIDEIILSYIRSSR